VETGTCAGTRRRYPRVLTEHVRSSTDNPAPQALSVHGHTGRWLDGHTGQHQIAPLPHSAHCRTAHIAGQHTV